MACFRYMFPHICRPVKRRRTGRKIGNRRPYELPYSSQRAVYSLQPVEELDLVAAGALCLSFYRLSLRFGIHFVNISSLKKRLRLGLRLGWRKLRKLWYKLVTLKSSPRRIAAGFALGMFLGFTPTFGIQTLLAIGLAALLRVNVVSTVVAAYITNVFTVVPIYWICYKVGRFLLGTAPLDNPEAVFGSYSALLAAGGEVIWTEFVGSVVVGLVLGVPVYFLVLWGVTKYRTVKTERRIKKMRNKIEGRKKQHWWQRRRKKKKDKR